MTNDDFRTRCRDKYRVVEHCSTGKENKFVVEEKIIIELPFIGGYLYKWEVCSPEFSCLNGALHFLSSLFGGVLIEGKVVWP